MDVVFLRSNELNWMKNFERAQELFGLSITLVDGSAATSIKNAYEIMLDQISSDFFMMIEGDNYVLDNCTKYIHIRKPVKFWAANRFGIAYEHGGVKIMESRSVEQQLKTNAHIYDNFEISANLFLESMPEVVSEHRFDWSLKNEWTTIAKELIKLYFWGHNDYLNRWLEHERPRQIFTNVQEIIKDVGFTQLFETLLPSLGHIYEDRFKE